MDLTELRDVTFDLTTLTLGEAAEAERQSGWTIGEIAKSRAALKTLALFVHVYRSSGRAPSWSELSNLRLLDVSPSTSRSRSAGASATSSD